MDSVDYRDRGLDDGNAAKPPPGRTAAVYAIIVLLSVAAVLNPFVIRLTLSPSTIQIAYLAVFDAALLALAATLVAFLRTNRAVLLRISVAGLLLLPFGLFAAELGLSYVALLNDAETEQTSLYQEDDLLGWVMRPGSVVQARKEGSYDVTYGIDADGLRAGNRLPAAPATVHVFGDSFTFGEGVNDDETALHLLAERLAGRWNVRNYGVSGYGVAQMLLSLMKHDEDIRPGDGVVFWVYSEDLMRNLAHKAFLCRIGARGADRASFPRFINGRWTAVALDDACGDFERLMLLSQSLPVGWLYNGVRDRLLRNDLIAKADSRFEEARDLAESRGAWFRLVMLASPAECAAGRFAFDISGLRAPYASMLPFCPDGAAAVAAMEFPTDPHWNAEGNRWAAQTLERILAPDLSGGPAPVADRRQGQERPQ